MTECEAFALRHVSFVYETAGINAHGETDAANRLETDANRTAVAKNTARAAVDDVSLTIKRGEWVTIIGSNGSGKTTLSRMFAAVSAPTSGQINVLGEHLYNEERGAQRSVYVRARRHIAYVTQNPEDHIVGETVKDDVAFEPENLGWAPCDTARTVDESLHATGMMYASNSDPHNLSGGQQQRVALASALAAHPDILILDEPFAYVDGSARRALLATLEQAHARGVTIVIISHHLSVGRYGQRVIELSRGRIVRDLSAGEFEAEFEAEFGNGDSFHACNRENIEKAGIAVNAQSSSKEPLLSTQNLSITFAGHAVLSNINLSVNHGDFLTISGANGSGKTTLVSALAGITQPQSGSVHFHGQRIGIAMQKVEKQLFASTVYEDIAFGPRNLGLSETDIHHSVQSTTELLGITHLLDSSVWNLSGGQQRLVALAGVLAMQPDLIILDEPTAGLDASTTQRILGILRSLHKQGLTIIMVTHELEHIKTLATRAFVLDVPAQRADEAMQSTVRAPQSTFDPRALTLTTLAILFTFFALQSPAQLLLGLAVTVVYVFMTRIRLRDLLTWVTPFLFFICVMGLFNLFVDRSGSAVFATPIFTVTTGGAWSALLYAGRFALLAVIAVSYLHILPPTRISDAVENMAQPLTRVGIPVHQLSLMSTLALRFIPLLSRDFKDLTAAQELRGATITHGPLGTRLRSLQALIVPAFANALRHADKLSVALDVRGYDPDNARVPWRVMRMTWRDYALISGYVCYLAVIVTLAFI